MFFLIITELTDTQFPLMPLSPGEVLPTFPLHFWRRIEWTHKLKCLDETNIVLYKYAILNMYTDYSVPAVLQHLVTHAEVWHLGYRNTLEAGF